MNAPSIYRFSVDNSARYVRAQSLAHAWRAMRHAFSGQQIAYSGDMGNHVPQNLGAAEYDKWAEQEWPTMQRKAAVKPSRAPAWIPLAKRRAIEIDADRLAKLFGMA